MTVDPRTYLDRVIIGIQTGTGLNSLGIIGPPHRARRAVTRSVRRDAHARDKGDLVSDNAAERGHFRVG